MTYFIIKLKLNIHVQNDFINYTHYVLPQDFDNIVVDNIRNFSDSLSILHHQLSKLEFPCRHVTSTDRSENECNSNFTNDLNKC